MNLNTVILAGSLTGDPVPGARKHDLCTFTLSFDGPFGFDRGSGTRRRDFVPVVAFGRTAEACLRLLCSAVHKCRYVPTVLMLSPAAYPPDTQGQ